MADLGSAATGGEPARSVVATGAIAGSTLHDAIERFGDDLLGRLTLTESGDFPLLVKYLDARENLSIQVHPSPEYVAAHPDAFLKHEAWVILDAAPGSVVYKGLREGVTPDDLRLAIKSNDEKTITALFNIVPAKVGECHYLPSGTCHALGAGILVAEVQTPSDTTFRVYDWGRPNRALHIEQAMQCIHFGPPEVAQHEKRTHIAGMFTTISRLCECEAFRIERVRMSEGYEQEIPYDQPAVWMVLKGGGRITIDRDSAPVTFKRGDTMLIPANMNDARVALDTDTVWLEVTFPATLPEEIG